MCALTMGISDVTVSLALSKGSPVGQATTMTPNQAALSGESAVGGAVGGRAAGDQRLRRDRGQCALFCLAAAAMVWWSCPRVAMQQR